MNATAPQTEAPKALHHNWEPKVGRPPYRFVALVSFPSKGLAEANPMAYQAALRDFSAQANALGVAGKLGVCDVCGAVLMNNYVCANADGARFVVGCECVRKLGDTRLTTEVEEVERKRVKALRDAARRAKEAAEAAKRAEARAAREAAERAANDGKTLAELETERQNRINQFWAAVRGDAPKVNRWLTEVLETRKNFGGSFVPAMIAELQTKWVCQLSPRQREILREIYGKAHGRKMVRDNAMADFDARVDTTRKQLEIGFNAARS